MAEPATTSWAWQLQQVVRNGTEWWELQTQGMGDRLAGWELPDWLEGWPQLDWPTLLAWAIWGLLVLVVCLGAIALLRQSPQFHDWWQQWRGRVRSPASPRSVPPPTLDQWLVQAEQARQRGDYEAACRCLYQALLQLLSDRHIAPVQQSRTDGEYRQLVAGQRRSPDYQLIFRTHEQIQFGGHPATLDMAERCQRAYRAILADLAAPPQSPADRRSQVNP